MESGASPNNRKKPMMMRNSRVGVETLSIQEFKENLGSFEDVFDDEQVKRWSTDIVVEFLKHIGFEEYTESFVKNQIIGENLLKMTDEDMKDLGIKAQGHIVKFRQAVQKLVKINDTQNRTRKLNKKLKLILRPKKENDTDRNFIRWNTEVYDENELDNKSSQSNSSSVSTDSAASINTSKKTGSIINSDDKKLGSIDISLEKNPRKNSDIHLELRSSTYSNQDSAADQPALSPITQAHHPPLTHSSSLAFYNKNKPKLKRSHSLMSIVAEEVSPNSMIPPEMDLIQAHQKNSESSKYF